MKKSYYLLLALIIIGISSSQSVNAQEGFYTKKQIEHNHYDRFTEPRHDAFDKKEKKHKHDAPGKKDKKHKHDAPGKKEKKHRHDGPDKKHRHSVDYKQDRMGDIDYKLDALEVRYKHEKNKLKNSALDKDEKKRREEEMKYEYNKEKEYLKTERKILKSNPY